MNWFRALIPNPEKQIIDGNTFEFGQFNNGWYGEVQRYPGTLSYGDTKEELFDSLKSAISYIKGTPQEPKPIEIQEVKPKEKPLDIEIKPLVEFSFNTEEIAKAYLKSFSLSENQRSEQKGKSVLIYQI